MASGWMLCQKAPLSDQSQHMGPDEQPAAGIEVTIDQLYPWLNSIGHLPL